MQRSQPLRRCEEAAFAKVNLGLAVRNRRPDGYHDIETVFQAIDLCDDVTVSMRPALRPAVELVCDRKDLENNRNLAWRAAESLLARTEMKAQVRIAIRKVIPTGAGLGGGSSDAAAVLRALDVLSFDALPRVVLHEVACELGSDVPYFLTGGTALGGGRGTEVLAVPDLRPTPVLLVLPEIEVSTSWAYRALAEQRASGAGETGTHDARIGRDRITDWLQRAGPKRCMEKIGNDFEPVVFRKFPAIAECKRMLLACGARSALLSGTGSAVFGLFGEPAAAHAAAGSLRRSGRHVALAEFLPRASVGLDLEDGGNCLELKA